MVYKRPQRREHQTSNFRTNFQRNHEQPIARDVTLTPEELERNLQKIQAEREQKFLEYLPVFDLESTSKESKEQKSAEKTDQQPEENTKKQKSAEKEPKKTNDGEAKDGEAKPENSPSAEKSSQNNTAQSAQTNPTNANPQANPVAENAASPVTPQASPTNTPLSTNTQAQSVTPRTIPTTIDLGSLPTEPIFVANNLKLAQTANPETILGKTKQGGIIYLSQNPSAERSSIQQGIGIKELPSSEARNIYQQQQEKAELALSSVNTQAKSSQSNLGQSSQQSISQIKAAIHSSLAANQTEIAHQKQAITNILSNARTSTIAQSAVGATQKAKE